MENKKTIFSGIQPSGCITLGNYLGSINNWTKLQDQYNCLYCVVDMHAITVRQAPADLRKASRELLIQYIAAGLDPQKNIMYIQSHVSQHAELSWVLSCFTYMGELNRMTQFKEKSLKHSENINAGLFTYPVLMAADILLYQTDLVPVGEDQKQHLEITRDIANRMNSIYENLFTVPEPYIMKSGGRIMALQDPSKKMSKSDENKNNTISLLDTPDIIINKFKRAVTDSDKEIRYSEDKPGISNLINIYCAVTGKTIEQTEKEFDGMGYGDFKLAVGQVVADKLKPLQQKFNELSQDKTYIDNILKTNAEKASHLAEKTLKKVHKKIGFLPKFNQ